MKAFNCKQQPAGSMNSAFSALLKVRYWTYVMDPNPHLITYLIFKVRYKVRYKILCQQLSNYTLTISRYTNWELSRLKGKHWFIKFGALDLALRPTAKRITSPILRIVFVLPNIYFRCCFESKSLKVNCKIALNVY